MNFDPQFAVSIIPKILTTLHTTALATVLGCIGASFLGLTWEILRRSSRLFRPAIQIWIDFVRCTPILVQIYFMFFVLPEYGIRLPPFAVGTISLSIYYSGYLAEVFKGGIETIPKGQFEASRVLGLSRPQLIWHIVLPQMFRNIAAPMGNYFVSLLKATPYLAVISVPEMLSISLEISSNTFRYTEPMLDVGLIFLTIALIFSWMVRLLERHLRVSRKAS